MSASFADRLNRLLVCAHPPGTVPYTPTDVVRGLRRLGVSMSAAYLSQLRTGARTNPSQNTLEGLALFFRVSPLAFTHDDVFTCVVEELEARHIVDVGARVIAGRVAGLSPTARRQVLTYVEGVWRREGHQEIPIEGCDD